MSFGVNTDIDVLYRELNLEPDSNTAFRPFTIWIYEDNLLLRSDTYSAVLPVSGNAPPGSNILFPRNAANCDYDVNSMYYPHVTLCSTAGATRIYILGNITSEMFERMFYEYTLSQLDIPLNTGYISYTGTLIGSVRYIRNNIAGVISLLSQSPTYIYAVHVDDFINNTIEVLNWCFEDASKNNRNVFVDTGLCVDVNIYQRLQQTAYEFGYRNNAMERSMFFIINTPFVNKINSSIYPVVHRYNIIVFAGHILLYFGNNLHGYVPVSTLYAGLLAMSPDYYNNIVNKPISFEPKTNLRYYKKDLNYIHNVISDHYLNIPYIDDEMLYLYIPKTTENNSRLSILRNENNARFIVDLNIEMLIRFKSLIGLINEDDDTIQKRIEDILSEIYRIPWFTRNRFIKGIQYNKHRRRGNKLEIDIVVELYNMIETIHLWMIVSD